MDGLQLADQVESEAHEKAVLSVAFTYAFAAGDWREGATSGAVRQNEEKSEFGAAVSFRLSMSLQGERR